jgi:hypothetical protein
MDGGPSLQVFEGVDYSLKEVARQRRMELLQDVRVAAPSHCACRPLFMICRWLCVCVCQAADSLGRRERKTAISNYNEAKSFHSMLLGTGLSRGVNSKGPLLPKILRYCCVRTAPHAAIRVTLLWTVSSQAAAHGPLEVL